MTILTYAEYCSLIDSLAILHPEHFTKWIDEKGYVLKEYIEIDDIPVRIQGMIEQKQTDHVLENLGDYYR